MVYARSGASAFTQSDGSVLVVGGQGASGAALTSAERFDLATGKWAVMPGRLTTASLDQSAIVLKDGRVFVTSWPDFIIGHWSTADVQIFDPKVASASPSPSPTPASRANWSSVPDIAAPFGNYSPYGGAFVSTATATTLTNGRVLVIGTGPNNMRFGLSTATNGLMAAIYDPASGQSRLLASPQTITATGFTTTLLRSGKVLVVGGGAELYDPATDVWSPAGFPAVKRFGHTATLLADGRVLVAAGLTGPEANGGVVGETSAEIYDPNKSNSWSWAASLPLTLGEDGNTATLLPNGDVLVVSGSIAAAYNPKSNRWSLTPGLREPALIPHTATPLPSGKVLVLGGCAQRPAFGCGRFAPPEVFDPATNSWSQAAPMQHGREAYSATLLRNGRVLVAGGFGSESVVASSELYDPVANRWDDTGDMKVARAGPAATLMKNGSVLVIGGSFLDNLRSVELFTPPPGPQPSGSGSAPTGLSVPLVGGAAVLALLLIIVLVTRVRTRRRRIA